MTSLREEVLESWWEFVEDEYRRAEEATNGCFLRPDRRAEFIRFFGPAGVRGVMFSGGPAHVAFYFASEELLRWWREHPRLTRAEFAWSAGHRSATVRRAVETAQRAKAAAAARAWESIGGRR